MNRPDAGKIRPRQTPCSSCPYRRDVPSGLWAEHEYNKLPGYDGDTGLQALSGAFGLFFCHQQDGHLCAGWVGCHDMDENLAIRISGPPGADLDIDAIRGYTTDVPLFASGREAAEHGKRDIEKPGDAACRKAGQLARQQKRRGNNG